MRDEPHSTRPAIYVPLDSDSPTRALPIVEEASLLSPHDAAELAGVLLPQERPVLSSRPHPIVLVGPALGLLIGLIVCAAIALFQEYAVIGGHHHTIALTATAIGRVLLGAAGIFCLVQVAQLLKALSYYLGFRVVATNRRVFVVRTLLNRSMHPLGNAGMARSSLHQGPLGRLLNFGTIYTGEDALRDVRYPVALWRSLEAVAHGVENGEWKPAIRQTIIP